MEGHQYDHDKDKDDEKASLSMSKGLPEKDDVGATGRSGDDASAQLTYSFDEKHLKFRSEAVLEEVSIGGVAEYIKRQQCMNIIVMVGAGISTSAGIPDFRSPGTGIFSALQKYNLPSPEYMFEIGYFKNNPEPFYDVCKQLMPTKHKPTPCHYFLRLLNDKRRLLRLYTQNVDGLERLAGIPPARIVEAHGTFSTSHCISPDCRVEYDLNWLKDQLQQGKKVPLCSECGDVVKPDVIFYGEVIPDYFHECVTKDFPVCELLIVIGTSLSVSPFAGLIELVPRYVPRLVINKQRFGEIDYSESSRGFNFDSDSNTRDVMWLGSCDDGCFALAEALGYGSELRNLIDREHVRLSQQTS